VSGQVNAAAALPPGERNADTHWMGGWVGPQNQSGRCEEEKNFLPVQESKPGRPARSPSLYRLSYSCIIIIIIMQFFVYLRADLTAQRPVRKQERVNMKERRKHTQTKDKNKKIYLI
jgi:hypothetical protein